MPRVDFHAIKDEILGKKYSLSFTIIEPTKMKVMNLTYRNKNSATDILSFPLSKDEGEIYICPEEAEKEAVKFERDYNNFVVFLFIHGCVHLKGFDHGCTMEELEVVYRKKFNI